ncbi:MAG TPA: hypothetical protein VHD32_01600 [Candidatus Didemnitutus sp.]|nr:hypothetical protein [Candidatus Didemnitutus sp.]
MASRRRNIIRIAMRLLSCLALPFLVAAGCAIPAAPEIPWVSLEVTVTKFDPDGTLFEMQTGGRPFEKGGSTLGPLTLVTVKSPGAFAGREFLIALPSSATGLSGEHAIQLSERGRTVVVQFARKALRKGPREVVEFAELNWPDH